MARNNLPENTPRVPNSSQLIDYLEERVAGPSYGQKPYPVLILRRSELPPMGRGELTWRNAGREITLWYERLEYRAHESIAIYGFPVFHRTIHLRRRRAGWSMVCEACRRSTDQIFLPAFGNFEGPDCYRCWHHGSPNLPNYIPALNYGAKVEFLKLKRPVMIKAQKVGAA